MHSLLGNQLIRDANITRGREKESLCKIHLNNFRIKCKSAYVHSLEMFAIMHMNMALFALIYSYSTYKKKNNFESRDRYINM